MGKVGIGMGFVLSILQGFFVAYPLWRIMVITDLLENNIGQADANYEELVNQTILKTSQGFLSSSIETQPSNNSVSLSEKLVKNY